MPAKSKKRARKRLEVEVDTTAVAVNEFADTADARPELGDEPDKKPAKVTTDTKDLYPFLAGVAGQAAFAAVATVTDQPKWHLTEVEAGVVATKCAPLVEKYVRRFFPNVDGELGPELRAAVCLGSIVLAKLTADDLKRSHLRAVPSADDSAPGPAAQRQNDPAAPTAHA